jgi:hypothetical protein
MKKKYYIPISLLGLASISLLVWFSKKKCSYPVFDLNYEGQVVQACFEASSLIHHQHKNSVMIEIVTPSATAFGENIFFENKREMALFICQILFESQNKKPVRYDSTSSHTLPGQKTIKEQDRSLFAIDSKQSPIIDRLFCMAEK